MSMMFVGLSRLTGRAGESVLALLDLGGGELGTLAVVMIAMAVGAVIAAAWSIYDRRYIGGLVRRMLDEGCTSAEAAKTLYEFGADDKLGIRRALREGGMLSRWVRCAEADVIAGADAVEADVVTGADAADAERQSDGSENGGRRSQSKAAKTGVDMDTAHYYVPPELADEARAKFSSKGSNAVGMVMVIAVLAAVLVLSAVFLPKLLGLL